MLNEHRGIGRIHLTIIRVAVAGDDATQCCHRSALELRQDVPADILVCDDHDDLALQDEDFDAVDDPVEPQPD